MSPPLVEIKITPAMIEAATMYLVDRLDHLSAVECELIAEEAVERALLAGHYKTNRSY